MNVMRISGCKFLWMVGILFTLINVRASAQVRYILCGSAILTSFDPRVWGVIPERRV
jgi:hypothetical protein